MNCKQSESVFSQRLDGELLGAQADSFDEHLAGCEPCRVGYENFTRSTRSLQRVGVGYVSRHYVDEIVAAARVAGAPVPVAAPPPFGSRLRPVVTHAAAVLLGAALLLLFARIFRPPSVEPLSVEPVSVEPVVHVVERIETRVEYVEVPVLVPTEPLLSMTPSEKPVEARSLGEGHAVLAARALWALAAALDSSRALLERPSEAHEPTHLVETPREEPSRESATPDGLPRSTTRRPGPEDRPAVVSLSRRGEELSLETRGTLDEVVPALIARIDDEDPEVRELVEGRLREIRAARSGTRSKALEAPRIGWKRWFLGESEASKAPNPREEWSSWWDAESVALASNTH
jgi:hypothetical protein